MQAPPKPRVNLEKAAVLLLEDSPLSLDILVQVLTGFGIKDFRKCATVDDAKAAAADAPLDIMMVAAALPGDEDGYDFVRWLRRARLQPNSFTPVIMLTGHTQQSKVAKARDCGANFIIAKPLTASVVLERIIWVSRDKRPFVETDTYMGPDRRFKNTGPPPGSEGRRRDDLPLEVGEATMPNMSQDTIDGFVQPMRITL